MAKKKDKYEAVADVLEKYDYGIDDLAKLFCRCFYTQNQAIGNDKAKVRRVIYGDNSKFILTIEMMPHEI